MFVNRKEIYMDLTYEHETTGRPPLIRGQQSARAYSEENTGQNMDKGL